MNQLTITMVEANIKNILTNSVNLESRVVKNFDQLKKVVETFKKIGYRIVLTQGCYDLIHEGHAAYLERARSLGDLLIVGVDSDEFTRKRKGPNRPVVPQEERVKMLAHLRHVDVITLREADQEIGALIRLVRPDVLVVSKSTKDFTNAMVKEYKSFCGKIVSLPPQSTTSTSARIRLLTIDGAEKLANEIRNLVDKFIANVRKN